MKRSAAHIGSFFILLASGCDGGSPPTDSGSTGSCPCFGSAEIAAIEAHAAAGGTRGCMTDVGSAGALSGALSSSMGPQVLQVTVQEIGSDLICMSGCSDLNDDTIDDCAGAALPTSETMIVDRAQHDACEALIAAACSGRR